jgi:diguanylate cyclase (GGDEF)-like protein/PAS domain S-box-containing protein
MLRRSLPAALGVLVIAVLGVAALQIGKSNLGAAEADRMASRTGLLNSYRKNIANGLDPWQRTPVTSIPRLAPEAGPVNEALLKQIMADRAGGVVFSAILTAEGRMVQSVPADTTIDVGLLGHTWDDARAGRAGVADAFQRNDEQITATAWPLGEGRPWGVLVMGESLSRTSVQALVVQIGAQNGAPGGLFVTDTKGVVVESAEPGLLGQQFLTPDEVRALPGEDADVAVRASIRHGDDTTIIAARLPNGFAMGFEQRTDVLLGDLRAAQHQRDLTLLGILGVSLTALVLFQLAREIAARRAEARIHSLLRNGQDLIAVVDGAGQVTFLSAAIENLLGQRDDVWNHRPLGDLCHADDRPRLAALLADAGSGPLLNLRLRTVGGEHRWFDVEASDLRDHPEVAGILLTCHEVGDRKQLQDELSYQATHDRLTGLPNRAEFTERLEALMTAGRPLRSFALLYVDLDHFKPVNDSLGHDAGDHVLVTVAERLRAAAGANGFVSRLGGDEFAILLDGAGEAEALLVAERLLEAARTPIAVNATLAHLDASIGIALADPSMALHSVEQLVRRADEAMYRAKRAGRGRFDFASSTSSTTVAPAIVTGGPSRIDLHAAASTLSTAPSVDERPADGLPNPGLAGERRRFRAAAPLLGAVAVVLIIAAAGFVQTVAGQRAAETERMADLNGAIARSAIYYSRIYDPRATTAIANAGPWTFDGSEVDQAIVTGWTTNPQVAKNSVAFLVALDGRVLATAPAGASASAALAADQFDAALLGQPGYLPWIDDPDEPRSYYYMPITRDGKLHSVLVFGFSLRKGPGQEELERTGGAVYRGSAASLLDSDGVVYSSSDRTLVGQRLADPSQLTGIPPGESRWLDYPDGVLSVAPMTATSVPTYVAMTVPNASFYSDLRKGESQRDLSLLGLVMTSVVGLALMNHRREQAVRRSEQRLDALVQHAHDVVVVVGADGRATFVSSAVHRLLGYHPTDRLGQDLIDLVHPGDRATVLQLMNDAVEQRTASVSDARLRDSRGDHRWFDIDAVDLRSHPEVSGILLTCHEVTERKALQDQLAYRATRDPLTGLPNRATLNTRLEQLVDAEEAGPFAILFVDLDHFKPVNDTLGHDTGDEVLKAIAERFRLSVRGEEDGRAGDLVCRLGGDEFAIVLLNVTEAIAEATAARLVEEARRPITVNGTTVQVGATVGVSVSHPHREDPGQAMRKADQAMYSAKEAGRNTFAVAPSEP